MKNRTRAAAAAAITTALSTKERGEPMTVNANEFSACGRNIFFITYNSDNDNSTKIVALTTICCGGILIDITERMR